MVSSKKSVTLSIPNVTDMRTNSTPKNELNQFKANRTDEAKTVQHHITSKRGPGAGNTPSLGNFLVPTA